MKGIFLMGPTASGKTALAIELARIFPLEIISVDSAQVFRHMDVGTAKPDKSILAEFPHHLIDIVEPTDRYSAGEFLVDAKRLEEDIAARGKIPLFVGGTMLYFKALAEGLADLPRADPAIRAQIDIDAANLGWPALHNKLSKIDPETAARLEPGDSQRIQRALEVWMISGKPLSEFLKQETANRENEYLRIALQPSNRSILHERIAKRFQAMLLDGLVEETESLKQRFALDSAMPSMRAVGYRQAWHYLAGDYGKEELKEKGIAATRQLAKRQITWLRGMNNLSAFDCLSSDLDRAAKALLEKNLDK
jgi:tRNA dimethylallyltransferase